jgi:hypothetical protein
VVRKRKHLTCDAYRSRALAFPAGDGVSCATSWMRWIKSNASVVPPVTPLSATGSALRQLPSLIRRGYRTRHPSPSPGERWRSYRAGPDQWERARALRAQGWSIQAIGREVSQSPKTVRSLLNRTTPPSREYVRQRHVPRLIEPFLPYLLQRWADGCRNGRQLTREIEQPGYLGKGCAVRWMIARWCPPKKHAANPNVVRSLGMCYGCSSVHRIC